MDKQFEEFCKKEVDAFADKVTKLFTTPKERLVWALTQPRFQDVFMLMTHQLGLEKTRKVVDYYFEVETRIKEFTDGVKNPNTNKKS